MREALEDISWTRGRRLGHEARWISGESWRRREYRRERQTFAWPSSSLMRKRTLFGWAILVVGARYLARIDYLLVIG